MRTKTSSPLESNGHRSQLHRNPAVDLPSPSEGIVLEDALKADRFRDGDCAAVCPGCGTIVTRHYEGLSDPLVLYQPNCRECGVELQRWSVVVVPSIQTTAVPPIEKLQARVQNYWERQFRVGVVDDTLPHTREFTEAVQKLADSFGWNWDVACPLCDRSVAELERDYLGYHHWEYETDIGTSLCRECHDYLHGGEPGAQANQQDWRAKKMGLRDFRDLAIIRLVRRDRAVHDRQVDEDDSAYAKRLRRRYNVPVATDRITKLASDIQYQDHIVEHLDDQGPSPDVKVRGIYPV